MAYSSSLIAAIFVKKAIAEKNYLTQMKLQKMVYFAHGYHLAKYDQPLVNEAFQAWKFGPVLPQIYQDYKLYGSSSIFDMSYSKYRKAEFADLKDVSENARHSILFTWDVTKKVSASKLSDWTHLPNSPWAKVYRERDIETPIENLIIKDYFKGFLSQNMVSV